MRKTEAVWHEKYNRWQINVQRDGQRKAFYSSVTGKKGKIEAEKKADKWLEGGIAADTVRVGQLWEDFLSEAKTLTGTGNYKNHEKWGRLWILPEIKHRRVSTITDQDWQNCISKAYKKGLAKKTLQNIRGSMTAFCRYARKRKLKIEPPTDIYIPKDAPVGHRNILQPDEIKALFSVDYIMRYGKPQQSFFIHAWRLIAATGLRRGELCGLKRNDVAGTLLAVNRAINSELEETHGKNQNAVRTMVQSKLANKIIQDQLDMLKQYGIDSVWLFPDEDGCRVNPATVYKHWYTYRNQHGMKASLHELRHTMISLMKGYIAAPILQPSIGHSAKTNTYGIYGQEIDGEKQIVADTVDAAFSKIIGDGYKKRVI